MCPTYHRRCSVGGVKLVKTPIEGCERRYQQQRHRPHDSKPRTSVAVTMDLGLLAGLYPPPPKKKNEYIYQVYEFLHTTKASNRPIPLDHGPSP